MRKAIIAIMLAALAGCGSSSGTDGSSTGTTGTTSSTGTTGSSGTTGTGEPLTVWIGNCPSPTNGQPPYFYFTMHCGFRSGQACGVVRLLADGGTLASEDYIFSYATLTSTNPDGTGTADAHGSDGYEGTGGDVGVAGIIGEALPDGGIGTISQQVNAYLSDAGLSGGDAGPGC